MLLYLVRHGQTPNNRDGLALGQDDVKLTDVGFAQARAVAGRLADSGISRLFSSPLRRASAVAEAISAATGVAVEIREPLTELDIGETEGLPFAEMRARYPEFLAQWAGPDAAAARMPGGESLDDVRARLMPFLDELREGVLPAIALVSHNFVLRVMLCELLGLPVSAFRSFGVDLASVSALSLDRGRVTVRFLNDCCHLDRLETPPQRL